MSAYPRYTSRDLEMMPDVEGVRYELIDGELHVSRQPSWEHQFAASAVCTALQTWSLQSRIGSAVQVPGLVLPNDDDVIPDVVWVSHQRRRASLDAAGHLTVGPELTVEVISPGAANVRRDRELKLKVYSRQGVNEYWIVDPGQRSVQVYRRSDLMLQLVATLWNGDTLTTPLLPGFELAVADLWEPE